MTSLTKEYFDQEITRFGDKFDALVELNDRLMKVNISLNEQIKFSKTWTPMEPSTQRFPTEAPPPKTEDPDAKKKLYYALLGMTKDTIIISGGGTFDVKDKLKENGFHWVTEIKSWKSKSKTLDEVKELFPHIVEKPVIDRPLDASTFGQDVMGTPPILGQ
jgi:hypothetical protein